MCVKVSTIPFLSTALSAHDHVAWLLTNAHLRHAARIAAATLQRHASVSADALSHPRRARLTYPLYRVFAAYLRDIASTCDGSGFALTGEMFTLTSPR